MTIWSGEINELNKLYSSFKGSMPDIVKEMEQLIQTSDPNVVMLYSRRCLEVIITDLCETELKRPRKTEPLKGIIDKLNSEEKVPAHIITSMISLNSMANYGAHPKDFDVEQVKPVLNNLAIIIKWYLKHKNFQIISKTVTDSAVEEAQEKVYVVPEHSQSGRTKSKWKYFFVPFGVVLAFLVFLFILKWGLSFLANQNESDMYMYIDAYRTVQIGDQIWMAENLRTTKFNDGTPIPLVEEESDWINLTTPGYCWYENDRKGYGATYGPLYNWYTVETGKLCPVGWHVPTETDWEKLRNFVGDSVYFSYINDSLILTRVSGMKLKEAGSNHWEYNDSIYSTDEFGFSALPGGARSVYGHFFEIGLFGAWWSSTEYDEDDAVGLTMSGNNNETHLSTMWYKKFGLSVRCVKDEKISEIDK